MNAPEIIAAADSSQILKNMMSIFIKRWWIIVLTLVVVVALAVFWTIRQPKIYEATTTIVIQSHSAKFLEKVNDVVDLGAKGYWQVQKFYNSQYEIIKSQAVAKRVVENEGLDLDPEFLGLTHIKDKKKLAKAMQNSNAAALLMRKIIVYPVKKSTLVKIKVRDLKPKRAKRLSLAVSKAYEAYTLDSKTATTRKALIWLRSQMADLKGHLRKAEDELYDFKKKNNLLSVSISDTNNTTAQNLSRFNQEYLDVYLKRIKMGNKLASLLKGPNRSPLGDNSRFILDNTLIQKLKAEYTAQLQKKARITERYLPKHPKVKAILKALKEIKKTIYREVKNLRSSYLEEFTALKKTEKKFRNLLFRERKTALKVALKELQSNRLERIKENHKRLFDIVLKRFKETDLTKNIRESNVFILEEPREPTAPVSPRVYLNLMMSILLGLFLGIGIMILVETLDTSIKTHDDIENAVKLTFLGIMPEIRGTKMKDLKLEFIADERPKSNIAESCRAIRTNLLFMSPDTTLKRMLVTSAEPREGKTTIASNLAISLAQIGNRTLIIDTDMRRPRIHKLFGLSREKGLSNHLLGECTLDEAILKTHIENLYLLPCGPLPPKPVELLQSEKFAQLLETLDGKFDRLILDSPPVLSVADALVLGHQVDGAIIVVHTGVTTKDMLLNTKRKLEDVQSKILGCVLNHLDIDDSRYRYRYRYYYYQYRYYGESEEIDNV